MQFLRATGTVRYGTGTLRTQIRYVQYSKFKITIRGDVLQTESIVEYAMMSKPYIVNRSLLSSLISASLHFFPAKRYLTDGTVTSC